MGKSCGQRRGRSREAPSETALAAARHAARGRRLAADRQDLLFGTWHYWWQAHLLDYLVDAQLRDPQPDREKKIARQIAVTSVAQQRVLGQQLLRRHGVAGAGPRAGGQARRRRRTRRAEEAGDQFLDAWVPEDGGGIPWRKQDQFFNAPANGPAGIFLARYDDRLRRAQQMSDWIDETLIDPETRLVFDGIKAGSMVRAQYTYCQGVVLGLETELAARTEDDDHAQRVHRLVAAVDKDMAPGGVITGAGGGDGGLFTGSWPATWRWSPPRCRTRRRRTPPPGTPPATSCSSRRSRRGTTVRTWTGCRCSDRSGTAMPICRRQAGSRPSWSRAPSTVRGSRARPVGAIVGLDADGGGATRVVRRRKHRHDRTRGLDTGRRHCRARQSHPLHGMAGRNRPR